MNLNWCFGLACFTVCACLGDGSDWILDPTGYQAKVTCEEGRVVLENGLVRREVTVRPGAATTSIRCLATGEEFVRGVSPEARVKFDDREYCVGGLQGQPILNYLREEWVGACTPNPGAYVYEGTTVGDIEERFKWKRRPEWLARDVAWPPKGKHVVMRYRPPADAEAKDIFGETTLALDFRNVWGGDWREVLLPKGERTSCRNEGKPGEIMALPGEQAFLEHDWPKEAVCVSATVDAGDGTGLVYATGVQVILEQKQDEPRELSIALCPSRRVFFTIVDGAEFQKAEGYNPDQPAELRLGLQNGTWCAWVKQGGKEVACVDLPAKAPAKTLRVGKILGCNGDGLKRMHIQRIACLKARVGQDDQRVAELPSVEVHYEIYDGAPLLSKWVVVSNTTSHAVKYDSFSCEELRLAEPGGQRDPEWDATPFNIHVESNFGYYYHWRGKDSAAVHFGTDSAYTTQEAYNLTGVNTLRCYPEMGPGVILKPGEANEGFRVWELLFDSTERERRGLALRRMYRLVSPWVCENPLMFHKTTSKPADIRAAIEQCRETGFELIIMSFGSEFDHESRDPEYRKLYKTLGDEARQAGLALGGYSLTASRSAGVKEDNVHNPNPDFGCSPCLCSKWGHEYHKALSSFMKEAGLGVFENDGPYAGNWCAATNHPYHAGKDDSRWLQWRAQSDLYRFCRENGVYVNQPDGYYFEGGSKGCGGYRETNCSLPRDRQLVIERQNVYDNSWTAPVTMLWMFVPLSQYQGGGAAATIEPLDGHLDYYSARFANLLGAGSQACWRGPRLYDTPRVHKMVKEWVDFYKRHRRVLDGDMIHLRRADGRDWDGWLMVVPEPGTGERGIASLFNPTTQDMVREIELPLYYAGVKDEVDISVGREDSYQRVKLDARGNVRMKVTIPASKWLHVFVRTPLPGGNQGSRY